MQCLRKALSASALRLPLREEQPRHRPASGLLPPWLALPHPLLPLPLRPPLLLLAMVVLTVAVHREQVSPRWTPTH
jgi:hypothetical protein